MTIKRIREQVADLRREVVREAAPERITVQVPDEASEQDVQNWLAETIGPDWRRNWIWIQGRLACNSPRIVSRKPAPELEKGVMLRFDAADLEVL